MTLEASGLGVLDMSSSVSGKEMLLLAIQTRQPSQARTSKCKSMRYFCSRANPSRLKEYSKSHAFWTVAVDITGVALVEGPSPASSGRQVLLNPTRNPKPVGPTPGPTSETHKPRSLSPYYARNHLNLQPINPISPRVLNP